MWKIYLILTVASILFIMISGVALWDAVNIAMTAIATGGFSVRTGGILAYNNPLLEMLVLPVMIAGALPFKIYFLAYYKKKLSFFHDEQAWMLFFLILIGFLVITADLIYFNGLDTIIAVRQGVFMAVAGVTSTGFQVSSPSVWAPVTVLFLVLLMFIGGSSGSTAGGIKLSRAALAYRGILWWFKRIFAGGRVVVPFRYSGKIIPKADAEAEVSRNMLIILLYLLTIFLCSILIMHFEILSHDTSLFVFEIVSAICNNGISTGVVSASLTPYSKIIFIFAMWIGRLEILPVIVFFMGLFKGFEK